MARTNKIRARYRSHNGLVYGPTELFVNASFRASIMVHFEVPGGSNRDDSLELTAMAAQKLFDRLGVLIAQITGSNEHFNRG